MDIVKIPSTLFTWHLWRAGSPLNLMVSCREVSLFAHQAILRKYAIGFCDGSSLVCRPKFNCVAIMFFKDEIEFWFHLTTKEFEVIFK